MLEEKAKTFECREFKNWFVGAESVPPVGGVFPLVLEVKTSIEGTCVKREEKERQMEIEAGHQSLLLIREGPY